MIKPVVTIGICGKDCEDTIGMAIESTVEQDFPHELMEIVFVDDGSHDRTLQIMRDYASMIDIPSKIISGEWRGLGKARNSVIDSAEGDYIIWLDSDETIAKDFVRKQVELMKKNPKAGIATGNLGMPNELNLVLVLDLIPSVIGYRQKEWKDLSKLPGTGGSTYRVTAAREVGGFDENLKGAGEDIEMAGRILEAGWSIIGGNAVYYEHHGKMATWKILLKRYSSSGVHGRYLYGRSRKYFSIYKMNPLASFVRGLFIGFMSYRTTRRAVSFLLPFHYTLKMTAWFWGFTKGK